MPRLAGILRLLGVRGLSPVWYKIGITLISVFGPTAGWADDLQLLYPDNNVSSRPFIEFRARGGRLDPQQSSVGHTFVLLGREYDNGLAAIYGVGGFYPKHGDKTSAEVLHMVLSSGSVKYTIDDLREDERFKTYITPEQETKVKFVMKNWNTKKYSVVYHNCVGLVRDVAKSVGLNVPTFDVLHVGREFPVEFLQQLQKSNQENSAVEAGNREADRIQQQRDASIAEGSKVNADWNAKVRKSQERRNDIERDNRARQSVLPPPGLPRDDRPDIFMQVNPLERPR